MIKRTYGFLRTLGLSLWCLALTLAVALIPMLVSLEARAEAQWVIPFVQVDQNVDGVLSEAEFLAGVYDATPGLFAKADANSDTVLTWAEYESLTPLPD